MILIRTIGLFVLTAPAEIVGCFLPYLCLKRSGSPWLLLPAASSLALFAWLLTLHPAAAGRSLRLMAACISPALLGMSIIVWGGWRA
jgi:drug/metabolite transporter superfamily protein YnfA